MVFIAVMRYSMPVKTLIRKNIFGAVLQLRGLVHYHHEGKNGGIQTDVVLGR